PCTADAGVSLKKLHLFHHARRSILRHDGNRLLDQFINRHRRLTFKRACLCGSRSSVRSHLHSTPAATRPLTRASLSHTTDKCPCLPATVHPGHIPPHSTPPPPSAAASPRPPTPDTAPSPASWPGDRR